MKQKKRIGDILIESELITKEQLDEALKEKKPNQKIGDYLLEKNYITENQLISALEQQLEIEKVTLSSYPIDKKVMNLVPKELAKHHFIFPLQSNGDKLLIAMADPLDFYAIEDIRLVTGFHIERAIATKNQILQAIHKYYDSNDESMQEFLSEQQQTKAMNDTTQIEVEDSPIVKLVNQLLASAYQQKASDIHIDPHEHEVYVRFRVDGLLKTEQILPKTIQSMLTARIKIMSNLDITEMRIPQDGRIKVKIDRHEIDLRVSTLPLVYGEKIVMRILDLGSNLNDLKKLGFNKLNLERFYRLIEEPNGIILITGPTGSGKSSTLYAALNHLNTEEVNIITVEDPVEYQLEGINQVQVNPKVGLTFSAGLRSILRQDPNIVMVGEIRDTETAEIAVRASLTGHLVLSTLHTNDSIGTIFRLIDMGVEPFLVASSVTGIMSQRLVRRICRDCQEEHIPSEREREIFQKRGIKIEKVIRGKGCPSCNHTGYKGRIAVHELLVVDDNIKQMMMNKASQREIHQYARKQGTIFLMDDGLLKVKKGLTTTEEVLRIARAD